jgi:hypothetical protein
MTRFERHDVELAERYAAALETIERLQGSDWSENDCELAERYAEALADIELKTVGVDWGDNDVDLAERYVQSLERIEELQSSTTNPGVA